MIVTLAMRKLFNSILCDFWEGENGEVFMTISQLSRVLDYPNESGISNILDCNEHLKEEVFSSTSKVKIGNSEQITRIFTEEGIYEVMMLSEQPKAREFREFVCKTVKALRKGKNIIHEKEQPEYPWFVKWHKGRPIITVRDFNELVGFDITKLKKFFKSEYFKGGLDYNGLGQGPLRKEFERINNVHYEEETFIYLYISGVKKALKILIDESKISPKLAKVILDRGIYRRHPRTIKFIHDSDKSATKLPTMLDE